MLNIVYNLQEKVKEFKHMLNIVYNLQEKVKEFKIYHMKIRQ